MLLLAVVLAGSCNVILFRVFSDLAYAVVCLIPEASQLKECQSASNAPEIESNSDFLRGFSGKELIGLLVLPIFASLFFNRFISGRIESAKIVSKMLGDLVELWLQEAIENRSEVELTMANGKSYVGYPIESGVTTSPESDVTLLLTMSGHRDVETRQLNIDTFYLPVSSKQVDQRNFSVVLPKNQIQSVRRFEPEVYQEFMNQRG